MFAFISPRALAALSPCARPGAGLARTRLTPLALFLSLGLLAGCAQLAPEGGVAELRSAAAERGLPPLLRRQDETPDAPALAELNALLAEPLTEASAVRAALLNHRGLQSALAALGVADAERVQWSRLPNPGFSFKRTRQGDAVGVERTLGFNLMALINLPANRRWGEAQFALARAEALETALAVAADARRAWVLAVAADEARRYAEQVAEAARASELLAREMQRTGNWSRRDALREQAFVAEAGVQLARARREAQSARERLALSLGLSRPDALLLPDQLPPVPEALPALPDGENQAVAQRLDLQAERLRLQAQAESLGLVRRTRLINVLELGVVRNTTTGAAPASGYQLGLEIPLFDWGDARVAGAEARYLQQAHRLGQKVLEARSEVRERYAQLQNHHQLAATFRQQVLPLRQQLAEETLRRYNGMLISVFELLADAREQIAAVAAAQAAQRDYWLAEADLQQALGIAGDWAVPAAAPVPAGSDPAPTAPPEAQRPLPQPTPAAASGAHHHD